MDKKDLVVTMRIAALEHLVSHLLFMVAKSTGDPLTELRAYRKRVALNLEESTVPGASAVASDLLTQELKEAVDKILGPLVQRLERESGA